MGAGLEAEVGRIASQLAQNSYGINNIGLCVSELGRIANALERIAVVAEERRPTVVWKLDDKDQS